MPVTVAHATQTSEPDSGDGKISSDAWNESHAVTGLGTAAEADSTDFAAAVHTHDDRYYTEAETDALLAGVGGLADGDYGQIVVSGSGTVINLDTGAAIANLGFTPTSVTGLTGAQSVAAFKTGLSLAKADVGLGSVDNTADSAKNVLSATKLTTARNINGVAFDGSANITINAVDSTARVPETRTITTTAPLTGGGDLSANRTFAITAATSGAAGSMSAADKTKLDAISGTNTGDQTITLTGPVTGSGTGSFSTTITAKAVTLAKMDDVGTATVFYRKTAGTGAPEVQTLATLKTDLGLTGTNSGDQTSIVGITGTIAQFNTAITDGDLATGGGTATGTNTGDQTITLTGAVTGSGTGSFATAIAASAVTDGKLRDSAGLSVIGRAPNSTGSVADITGATADHVLKLNAGGTAIAFGQINTASIAADAVTYAKMQNVSAASRFLGRITASAGDTEELTGTQATTLLDDATTLLPGRMSAQDKTRLDNLCAPYTTVIEPSGSHTAARVGGTYGFGHGDPLAITGTGTLYPLDVIYLDPADFPAIGTLTNKFRIRCSLSVNDVAPTGNFTVGLHPVTRPATSGAAGLVIYTIGAAVAGSTAVVNTPAADSTTNMVGADFAMPAAGHYVIGMVATATVAASSHLHMSAMLQRHYSL